MQSNLNDYFQQLKTTQEDVELFHEDAQNLEKLGDFTHQAIYGKNNGIAETLLKYDSEHNTWPDRLPKFDIRRTPKEWVEEKLDEILKEMFEARGKVEQNMTRNELKAYDQSIQHHFNKKNMIVRLFDKIDQEYIDLLKRRYEVQNTKNRLEDSQFQSQKDYTVQRDFKRKLKNVDAAYKLIAYRYCRDNNKNIPDTGFIHFYDKQLQRDLEMPARPIRPIDYITEEEKKENVYYQVNKQPYMNESDKKKNYYEQYSTIKDGKLEDLDRQEAYFILENYRERSNLDEKAKDSLEKYFSNYENISFFEVNKIK